MAGNQAAQDRSGPRIARTIPRYLDRNGETDVETLAREIREELDVAIVPSSTTHVGTFQAQAHGHAAGIAVRMTCYTADYQGTLTPGSEVDELIWLTYADRGRVSPVDQLIFDHLYQAGQLT